MFGQEITNLNHLPHGPKSHLEYPKPKDSFIENRENMSLIKKNPIFFKQETTFPIQKVEKRDCNQKFEPWDEIVKGDPQYTVHYVEAIFNELKIQEKEKPFNYLYISNQKEINGKMRAILIDWLIDVHMKFKLASETLFLAVNILDRYLVKNQIPREKFQLLGISCLFLASKFEDIYPPDLKECLFVTENSYTKDDLLKIEGEILAAINFQIKSPTPLVFLERYQRIIAADRRMQCLSRYLLELALIDYKFLKYTSSNLATSALYLSGKVLKKSFWNDGLARETKMKEEEVRICAKELCFSLQNASDSVLQGVRRKYSLPENEGIAKIQLDRLFNK